MPGETAQVAEIAVRVSTEIFEKFGWIRSGTTDHNFEAFDLPQESTVGEPQNDVEEAAKAPMGQPPTTVEPTLPPTELPMLKKKQFPADVIFTYTDPYKDDQIFIHFDLKSYGESSLKARTTAKALQRLARTVAVAESSDDWRAKFAPSASNYTIHGGLFVYNHDHLALGRIEEFISKLNSKSIVIPEKKRLYVFSPRRIGYLQTIINDIKCMVSDSLLPHDSQGERLFYYQYGVYAKPQKSLLGFATAEMLLGPLLIQRFQYKNGSKQGYVVYYDGPGSLEDEFLYLFEMFLKRGLLMGDEVIYLRMANAAENAQAVFVDAKNFFVNSYHDLPAFKQQLDRVYYARVPKVISQFSTVELGMEN